jgi:hypothetical protein
LSRSLDSTHSHNGSGSGLSLLDGALSVSHQIQTSLGEVAQKTNKTGLTSAATKARRVCVNRDKCKKAKDLNRCLCEDLQGGFGVELLSTLAKGGEFCSWTSGWRIQGDPSTTPTTTRGSRRQPRPLTTGCFILHEAQHPSWVGTPHARPPGPRASRECPTRPKRILLCSKLFRQGLHLQYFYEPQARFSALSIELLKHLIDIMTYLFLYCTSQGHF